MDTQSRPNVAPLLVYRTAAGLSQVDLAAAAGLSPFTISRLERGLHSPNLKTVQAIARALGRSASAVFPPGGADDGS